MEERMRQLVEKAYNLLVDAAEDDIYLVVDDVIGYLGQALDDHPDIEDEQFEHLAKEEIMTVKFEYIFEFDAEVYDEKFVNVKGLAKDEAFRSLKYDIANECVTSDDFDIVEEQTKN